MDMEEDRQRTDSRWNFLNVEAMAMFLSRFQTVSSRTDAHVALGMTSPRHHVRYVECFVVHDHPIHGTIVGVSAVEYALCKEQMHLSVVDNCKPCASPLNNV